MDNWSTPVTVAWLALAGAALAVVLAVLGGGPGATVFWAVAALVFAVFAAHVLRARPRLAVDAAGVTVRASLHTYRWEHGQLKVLLRTTRRFGREGRLLELDGIDADGEERLVLLGRFDLGADPVDVHERLTELRAAGR